MATSKQKLEFQVGADTRKFKRGMGRIKGMAKKAASSLKAMAKGGLAIGGAAYAIDKFTAKLDEIGKKAKRLGVTTKFIQQLGFAAERSGSSMSAAESAVRRLQRRVYKAGEGTKSYEDALNRLGLSYDQLKDKSPGDMFKMVADRIKEVENATRKSALAQELMGSEASQLVPMFEDFNKLAKELESRGAIIKEEEVQAAEDFQNAMTNLKTELKATFANSGIIGDLEDFIEKLNTAAKLTERLQKSQDMGAEGKWIDHLKKDTGFVHMIMSDIFGEDQADRFIGINPNQKNLTLPAPSEDEQTKYREKVRKRQEAQNSEKSADQSKQQKKTEQGINEEKKERIESLKKEIELTAIKIEQNERAAQKAKIRQKYNEKIEEAENEKVKGLLEKRKKLELQSVDKKAATMEKEKTEQQKERVKNLQLENRLKKLSLEKSGTELEKAKVIARYNKKINDAESEQVKEEMKQQKSLKLKQVEQSYAGEDSDGKSDTISQMLSGGIKTSDLTDRFSRIGLTVGQNVSSMSDRLAQERNKTIKDIKKSLQNIEESETEKSESKASMLV